MIRFKTPPSATDVRTINGNEGTVSAYAISDATGVNYTLASGGTVLLSETGMFTGLAAGVYIITSGNSNGDSVSATVTVNPATIDTTNEKYRLEFENKDGTIPYTVSIYDIKHQYPKADYPVILQTTSVVHLTKPLTEDKTEVFAPSTLDMSIISDGTLDVDQFANADERTFYVEYFEDKQLLFRGWLLPDQVQNQYDDPPYDLMLTATDGLLSLKAGVFGDGTGIQMFGIMGWLQFVRYCLNQLDYPIGELPIIKSLQYNGNMDYNEIGNWADLFYDENGTPDDTYSALERLLKLFNLTIMQVKGQFVLRDGQVLSHVVLDDNPGAYNLALHQYDATGATVDFTAQVERHKIGIGGDLVTIDDIPPLSYDDSFKQLVAKVDFNLLSLLYPNPSFEVNAAEGVLPLGAYNTGGGVPNSGLTNAQSYIGDWSFKVASNGIGKNAFIEIGPIPVDQAGKLLNLSFNWKPSVSTGDDFGIVPSILPVIITGGVGYYLQQAPYRSIALGDPDSPFSIDYPDNATEVSWQVLDNLEYRSEGSAVSIKPNATTDTVGWQSFGITSPVIPGAGDLYFRFYGTKLVPYNNGDITPIKNGLGYISPVYDPAIYYLLDNLVLTLSDASEAYNKQIGETHTVTNLTNYAKSKKKTVDIDMFNYSANKRVAGNVFYGKDYLTAKLDYLWQDPFQTPALSDRLSGIIIRQIARAYQRPMYKLECTVASAAISFLSVFEVQFYEGKPFIPFSIEHRPMESEAKLVVVETDDTDFPNSYQYLAKFEKSAKKIVN